MMSTVSKGEEFDAVIIGAGHNGLVTAAYLAKAGLRVVVLERREVLGGAAATEEIFSGYQINTG
ncbi:MAG TPA: FAD-dependent oxidoreductase, partial [Anaerolineales bacterium]